MYPIVRQLEKITVKKWEAKVVKCAKNKSWVPRNPLPLGHLSVNTSKIRFTECVIQYSGNILYCLLPARYIYKAITQAVKLTKVKHARSKNADANQNKAVNKI